MLAVLGGAGKGDFFVRYSPHPLYSLYAVLVELQCCLLEGGGAFRRLCPWNPSGLSATVSLTRNTLQHN